MRHAITVEVTDHTFEFLRGQAEATHVSAESYAASLLEKSVENPPLASDAKKAQMTPEERQLAIDNFRRHFGSVSYDDPNGSDNEKIDADLAREYGDNHEDQ